MKIRGFFVDWKTKSACYQALFGFWWIRRETTSGFKQFHGIEKTLILRAFLEFDAVRFRAKIVKFKIIRGFFVDFLEVNSADFIED